MKVLLTGSSGRIGSQVIRALQEHGHSVRGFDQQAPRPGSTPDEHLTGSLQDANAVARAVDGVDAVLHLGALMSWHPRDENALFEANVRGTFNLLQAAARHASTIQRFVFASSGEVYPETSPVYQPVDEQHPTRPTSVYGMTKLLGEDMVQHFSRRTGLQTCTLRFSHTQAAPELFDADSFFSGPRFYVNAKLRQLRGLGSTAPAVLKSIAALEAVATDAEQLYVACSPEGVPYRMSMCDVRDMIQGVRLGLEHPAAANGIFNIGPAESFDFDAAVEALARWTGLPVHHVNLHTVFYRYDTSIARARETLGYAPQHTVFSMIDEVGRERAAASEQGRT
jgi:UDP-glucose 4-epimerase